MSTDIYNFNAKEKTKTNKTLISQNIAMNDTWVQNSKEYSDFLNSALKKLLIHSYKFLAHEDWESLKDVDFIADKLVSVIKNILNTDESTIKLVDKNEKIIVDYNKKYHLAKANKKNVKKALLYFKLSEDDLKSFYKNMLNGSNTEYFKTLQDKKQPNFYQILQHLVFNKISDNLNDRRNLNLFQYDSTLTVPSKNKSDISSRSKRSANHFLNSDYKEPANINRPISAASLMLISTDKISNNSNQVYYMGMFLIFPLFVLIFFLRKLRLF